MNQSVDNTRHPHWRFLIFTVGVAMLLNLIPMPDLLLHARPDWLTLVVFYWALILPRNFGVNSAWFIGLLEDVLSYALLGQHAVIRAFVAMVPGMANRRLKLFGLVEQVVVVFIVQTISIAIMAWVHRLTGQAPILLLDWHAAITTALLWPFFSGLLTWLDPMPRHFH